MGTRADFYVGRGKEAEWLGSITWDGYPEGVLEHFQNLKDEGSYRAAVRRFFDARDDVTLPEEGWPWPWEDSTTTDFSYAYDDGKIWVSAFGEGWHTPEEIKANELACKAHELDPDRNPEPPELWGGGEVDFPNMKDRTNPDLIRARSGLTIFTK